MVGKNPKVKKLIDKIMKNKKKKMGMDKSTKC